MSHSDFGSFGLFAGNCPRGILGVLQHYRHLADVAVLAHVLGSLGESDLGVTDEQIVKQSRGNVGYPRENPKLVCAEAHK